MRRLRLLSGTQLTIHAQRRSARACCITPLCPLTIPRPSPCDPPTPTRPAPPTPPPFAPDWPGTPQGHLPALRQSNPCHSPPSPASRPYNTPCNTHPALPRSSLHSAPPPVPPHLHPVRREGAPADVRPAALQHRNSLGAGSKSERAMGAWVMARSDSVSTLPSFSHWSGGIRTRCRPALALPSRALPRTTLAAASRQGQTTWSPAASPWLIPPQLTDSQSPHPGPPDHPHAAPPPSTPTHFCLPPCGYTPTCQLRCPSHSRRVRSPEQDSKNLQGRAG